MSDPASTPVVLADLGKEALRALLANLTQAKAFALEQAPDFCRQLIARDIGCALFLGFLFVVLSIILAVAARLTLRRIARKSLWNLIPVPLILGMTAIGLLCGSLSNFYDALYIHLAPKVYLVEQLMRMVR